MTYRIQRLVDVDAVAFALSGELDADHAARLRGLIAVEAPQSVRLDLGDVTVVDRGGLRFLLEAQATGITLVNCADYIRRWMAAQETSPMKAVRVHHFGAPAVLEYEEVPRPSPGDDEIVVRVVAAGVGPWDAWVRAGRSLITQTLPLIPGADFAGVVDRVGVNVTAFKAGDAVFGATNGQFTGAYAEYAAAAAAMVAIKPPQVPFVEAAAVPVVGCTAWQMVCEYGRIDSSTRVLIHGAGGNVGALAVQLAQRRAREVIATALTPDVEFVRTLGVDHVIDAATTRFETVVRDIDVVLDTVGGDTQARSYPVIRRGGVLVSSAAPPDQSLATRHGVDAKFFLVAVTTGALTTIGQLMATGDLTVRVGDIVPLAEARRAHDMLAGAPHRAGKIVLTTGVEPTS